MSAGLYDLPAGGQDDQTPHDSDEAYYVIRGRAVFRADRKSTAVGPGSVIYVRAGVEHRFAEIEEDLQLLVFFSSAASE